MKKNYKKKAINAGLSLLFFGATFQTQAAMGIEASRADFIVTLKDGHGNQLGNCHKLRAMDLVTCVLTLQGPPPGGLVGIPRLVTISNTGNSPLTGLAFTSPNPEVAIQYSPFTSCTQNQTLNAGAACNLGYQATADTEEQQQA